MKLKLQIYLLAMVLGLLFGCKKQQQSNSVDAGPTENQLTNSQESTPTESSENQVEYEPYYKGLENLEGEALAKGLYERIKDHKTFSYRQCYDILIELDRDPENPKNIECVFTDFSIDAENQYADGNGWNREHIWAKSRGDFGNAPGPGTDLHHLRASDVSTNSARNNRSFDEAENPYIDEDGNAKGETGCYTSNVEWVFEPRNERKGDIARMLFYMAIRYEGENGEPNLELVDYTPGRGSKEPIHGKLSTLLRWHEEDPVNDKERLRNNLVYQRYQGNRNPFIDHPEFARDIWGYDF